VCPLLVSFSDLAAAPDTGRRTHQRPNTGFSAAFKIQNPASDGLPLSMRKINLEPLLARRPSSTHSNAARSVSTSSCRLPDGIRGIGVEAP